MKTLQETVLNEGILSQTTASLDKDVEQEEFAKMSFAVWSDENSLGCDRFGEKLKKGDLVMFVYNSVFKLGKIKRAGSTDSDVEWIDVIESDSSHIVYADLDIENTNIVKITDKSKFLKYINSLNIDYSRF